MSILCTGSTKLLKEITKYLNTMNISSFSSTGASLAEAFYEHEVTSRSFEQLITERGNLFSEQIFNDVFNTIRDKLFILSDSEPLLTEEKIQEYTKKWNIKNLHESIDSFKKELGELYQKKNVIETELNKKKEKYNLFCEYITKLLELLEPLCSGTPEEDTFRKILNERIEWYYTSLNLTQLTSDSAKLTEELFFMKESLKKISSISVSTQCSICYENQISWYIDPCGHTLCGTCKERCNETTNCHYCSSKRNKYSRLYL